MADEEIVTAADKALFRKELQAVTRIAGWIDSHHVTSEYDVDLYLKKFKEVVSQFNKKYAGITLKIAVTPNHIHLRVLLPVATIAEAVTTIGTHIAGLQAAGLVHAGSAMVTDQAAFEQEVTRARDQIILSFHDQARGSSEVTLLLDKKAKKVELLYEADEIAIGASPEFQVAAHYMSTSKISRKIRVYDAATLIGFTNILSHKERFETMQKYDPPLHE